MHTSCNVTDKVDKREYIAVSRFGCEPSMRANVRVYVRYVNLYSLSSRTIPISFHPRSAHREHTIHTTIIGNFTSLFFISFSHTTQHTHNPDAGATRGKLAGRFVSWNESRNSGAWRRARCFGSQRYRSERHEHIIVYSSVEIR